MHFKKKCIHFCSFRAAAASTDASLWNIGHQIAAGKFVNEHHSMTECCICLDEVGVAPATTTPCGHVFHSACLFRALGRDGRCPLCRAVLVSTQCRSRTEGGEEVDEHDEHDEHDERWWSDVRRQRRNYDARRRRLERSYPLVARAHERAKAARVRFMVAQKNFMDERARAIRKALSRSNVRSSFRELSLARRSLFRTYRVYHERVITRLGERPW